MEFLDLLLKRRSIRKYNTENITRDELDNILKAGLLAPTGRNKKECMFLVIEDKKTLQKLSKVKDSGSAFISNANKAIVVVANSLISDTWVEDSSIALGYMHLMAANLSIASCWVQTHLRTSDGTDSEKIVRDILGLDEFYRIVGILALGKTDEEIKPYSLEDIDKTRVHFMVNLQNK